MVEICHSTKKYSKEIDMNTDKIYAESIASQYAPKEASKLTALKKLDRAAKRPALVFSIILGFVMTLILGVGLCLGMGIIGNGSIQFIITGTIIGLIGIIGISINYPLYNMILSKRKAKYAFDITELAKEIIKNAEE